MFGEWRYSMYRFVVYHDGDPSGIFRKYVHLDEVKTEVAGKNSNNRSNFSIHNTFSNSISEEREANANHPEVHVYLIKDIVDSLNTSVLLNGVNKENYLRMLTGNEAEFRSDEVFRQMCKEVGECDVF